MTNILGFEFERKISTGLVDDKRMQYGEKIMIFGIHSSTQMIEEKRLSRIDNKNLIVLKSLSHYISQYRITKILYKILFFEVGIIGLCTLVQCID